MNAAFLLITALDQTPVRSEEPLKDVEPTYAGHVASTTNRQRRRKLNYPALSTPMRLKPRSDRWKRP